MSKATSLICLTWLMRVFGGVTLLAVGGLLMPHAWMNQIHQLIGLGDLPDIPIIQYLTRSCSALYMFLGALFVYLSWDPVTHLRTIRFCSAAGVVFAVTDSIVGARAGLPVWWWVGSGVVVCAYCVGGWVLSSRLMHEAT